MTYCFAKEVELSGSDEVSDIRYVEKHLTDSFVGDVFFSNLSHVDFEDSPDGAVKEGIQFIEIFFFQGPRFASPQE